MDERRPLRFKKGEQIYIFRYPAGGESNVINELSRLSIDPNSGLDVADAAILSYMVGRRLNEEVDLERY